MEATAATTSFRKIRSIDEAVEEIMRIHRSLPERPGIEEVEAAKALIQNVDKEDQGRIEAISRQTKSPDVPGELFVILLEMQKNLVYFQGKEQKRDALKLLDLENVHSLFDDFIQRASKCLPLSSSSSSSSSSTTTAAAAASALSSSFTYANGSASTVSTSKPPASTSTNKSSSNLNYSEQNSSRTELFTRDDSYVKKVRSSFYSDGIGAAVSSMPRIVDSTLKTATTTSGQDGDKLSLIKLASLIEVSKKKGTKDLNLQNKLMDQIEWLPDSIGKLSNLVSLDLSENRIVALPATIGGLSSLTKLDLHSNKIAELPESIGDLLSLVFLDLRANHISSLPATFSRLVRLQELDLSSNHLSSLPESIGSLISLKILNVETNDIEEIPHSIGRCSSLKELHADYNRLKALPEAVGKIETLEVLSVRYNNIKQLPTTMSSLLNLKELNVSFNELESVPESLCFATSLVKINIGNNFADLQYLPRSIGNLENLEELDISNNQIRALPDSFRMLTKLRVLRVEQNPLEVPPRHIAEKGAQAVVQYMAELFEKKDVKTPIKQKKSWAQICFFSKSNKRKRSGMDYVKA
ncbi:plant intracellular Ras-group-related LRR protein 4 [Ricinus communis]|uniref:Leucine-rich repeat-containing protein, putative n=1 Tax=Ricinus communis TaxID=3988 RepID=B9T2K7_RICCO|nr:plant intracellular Ras-group-related LRR protein 4 [Ricinus communis]EEF29900.1 leucine-rich repeat-containing protein, putative [Ricinus communis]|eukprot:XP_002532476.1 plant intracellular Ras-group-related LRR protein 4 [Ricinus communis]